MAVQNLEDSDAEFVMILEDEDIDRDPLPVAQVDHLKVYRVTVEPGKSARDEHRQYLGKLAPTADEDTLLQRWGGGVYDVRGHNRRGHTLRGRRISIDGPPRPGPDALAPPPPVHETASGLAAIPGLSPDAQMVWTLLQQVVAQTREDARHYSTTLLELVRAVCTRPERNEPHPNWQLVMQMMGAQSGEAKELREALARIREDHVKTLVRNTKLEAGEKDPLQIFAEKAAGQLDLVMGLVAQKLAKDSGSEIKMLPPGAEPPKPEGQS